MCVCVLLYLNLYILCVCMCVHIHTYIHAYVWALYTLSREAKFKQDVKTRSLHMFYIYTPEAVKATGGQGAQGGEGGGGEGGGMDVPPSNLHRVPSNARCNRPRTGLGVDVSTDGPPSNVHRVPSNVHGVMTPR